MILRISAALCALAVLGLSPALAHEGHDHGGEAPVPAHVGPRAEAASPAFELVAIPRGRDLVLYLDAFASNTPVTGADIDVETPDGFVEAKAQGDGRYRLAAPWLAAGGHRDLAVTVKAGGVEETLTLDLDLPEPVRAMPSPPVVERSPRQPAALVADPGDGGGVGERTIALGGGVGAVALGGAAFLLFRRRRGEPLDAASEDASGTLTGVPPAVAAPAFRSPFTPPPAGRVPDGFDTARFGPHVRAAYAGPTPGNPSLSLKRRLARARFFDQRARIGQRFDTARRAAGFVTTRLRPATVAPVHPA